MNDYDFKSSKPNEDVSNPDPRSKIFEASKKTLFYKRDKEGTGILDMFEDDEVLIPHGYNFAPAFIIYEKQLDNDYWSVNTATSIYNVVNKNHLKLSNPLYPGLTGIRYRYYIFNQPLLPTDKPAILPIEKGGYGLLTSIAGEGVDTDRPENLSFNSEWGNFIEYDEELVVVPHPGGVDDPVIIEIENPLGYPCVHLTAIEEQENGNFYSNYFNTSEFPLILQYQVEMRAKTITFKVWRSPGSFWTDPETVNFKIKLYTADLEGLD